MNDRPELIREGRYWRLHAEETRTLAEEMTNPACRATMLRIAEGYDKLADQVDKVFGSPEVKRLDDPPPHSN